MAFCQYCGSQIPDDSKFCPNCGASVDYSTVHTTAYQSDFNTGYVQQEMPMKWYKFLIYVGLFLGAISNFMTGIGALTGSQYGDSSSLVYAYFSSLKTIDIIMGIVCIAMAAFAIVIRQKLAYFKADGPKMLILLYIANVIVSIVYMLLVTTIVSSDFVVSTNILSPIVISIVMIFVNKKYFDNRKHLFVN